MTVRSNRLAVVCVLGSVVVVACEGGDSSGDRQPPEATAIASAESSIDDFRELYLDARVGSASAQQQHEVQVIVHNTTEALIAKCMAAAGFDYQPVPADNAFGAPSEIERVEWVSEYGFGITELPDDIDEDDRNFVYYTSLNDSSQQRYDQTLAASDGAGCLQDTTTEAALQLGIGDIDGALATMESPLHHPDAQLIEAAWSDCAAAAGVDAPSILALTSQLSDEHNRLERSGADLTEFRELEIAAATATIECTRERNAELAVLTRRLYEQAAERG